MSRKTTVHARWYSGAGVCQELCSDEQSGTYYLTREGVKDEVRGRLTQWEAWDWYRVATYRFVPVMPVGDEAAVTVNAVLTEVES